MNIKAKNPIPTLIALMLLLSLSLSAWGKQGTPSLPQGKTPQGFTELGEGEKEFTFSIFDADKKESRYLIKTDEETVGAALETLGLIEGEEGPYGLYVKKVGGIFADYEKTSTYWSFYINGEYANSGVDKTEIKQGDSYAFKLEN